MKKLLSILLCLLLVISLGACGKKGDTKPEQENDSELTASETIENEIIEDIVKLEVPNNKSEAHSVKITEPNKGYCMVSYEFDKLNLDIPTLSKLLVELKDTETEENFNIKCIEIAKTFNSSFNYDFNFENISDSKNSIWESNSNIKGIVLNTNDNSHSLTVEDIKNGVSSVYIETDNSLKNREDVLEELIEIDDLLGIDFSKDAEFIKIINSLSYTLTTEKQGYNKVIVVLWEKTSNRNISFEIYGVNDNGNCYYKIRYGYELTYSLYKDIENGTYEY